MCATPFLRHSQRVSYGLFFQTIWQALSMLQIGQHKLINRVALAPMAGVTDLPFRRLCARFGAGLAVSEMVTSNALLYATEKTRRRTDHRRAQQGR